MNRCHECEDLQNAYKKKEYDDDDDDDDER
jgi:hypothetical protein